MTRIAVILLIAEFCHKEKRHIISVFKLIQDLLAPSKVKGRNQFQLLMAKLPDTHKAKWFAGAALNTAEQSMQSVLSTALSRLNSFLDSELEQILCFDTAIDAEMFCKQKTAVFLVMPEEDNTKYFIISLILQQLYREILVVADENGGKLDNRVVFYWDEVGTIPKIESAEMMFSASRSRRVSIVPMIQSFAQLNKNYGKEGAEIIIDNCQDTIFGGFAPNSESAEVLSKSLGNKTVMSGSISRGKNDPSQSLQMIQRPLMTPDELKSLPKGNFIVSKTGSHPMRTKLKLFLKWGITFEEPYEIEEKSARKVAYADKECEIEYDRDVCCAIEDYMGPSSAYYFYRELCVLFEKYEMICYHSTKTLDENRILTSGLQTNEWDAYSTHIIKTLHTLKVSEEEITQAVEAIKKKYDWKYPSHGREPQLCFYSDTGLLSEDMHAGYEQFCENIGGELARDALKNEYPQLYEYLRANGKAFLVKFKIPFSNIKDYNQDSIIYQFVSYFAGRYFWNYDYEIHFDGNTDKEIPATDILELIPYTVNRYYFYE